MFDEENKHDEARARKEFASAHDFDPKDPLFGLSKEELSGPKLSRRAVLRLMAAAGLLSGWQVLSGCTPSSQQAAPSEGTTTDQGETQQSESAAKASRGGELNAGWAGTGEIRTLDPAQINQVLQFQIASNVFGGLTHINPDLTAEGDLASDWTVSDDGLEWTFTLREGVTFHNGDPFTADDVVFTYNRSKDPEQSIHAGVLENVSEVQAVDEKTVKIVLAKPQASLLVKTLERTSGRAMTIVNKRALEELGPEQYGLTPVGTGPFRVTEHTLGQGVVLERYEDYYDPERPKLDKVTFTPIPEPEPLAAAIEAGDVQIIGGNAPAAELIDRFESNSDLVVSTITGPGFQALWLNPWREPFKVSDFNKPLEALKEENGFKVRLAIAKAINRKELIERALFGRGEPAYGSINPAMRFFYDKTLAEKSEQRFELEAAKQLLADAGFPDGKGFPKLKLTITPSGKREGEVIANLLKKNLNIEVELDIKDFPVLIDHFDTMDFDLLRIGSGGDYDPDDVLVDWIHTESKFNGPNRKQEEMPWGYFSNDEVDKLIDQERVETDQEKRKELVQKANEITSNRVAAAFLFHPMDILVYRKEVTYPEESRIPGLVDLDRVTIQQ